VALQWLHTHSQLVAKVAHGRKTHAGDAQMFAERRRGFQVVLVERDDAIEPVSAHYVTYGLHRVGEGKVLRQIEHLFDTVAWPIGIAQLFRRDQ